MSGNIIDFESSQRRFLCPFYKPHYDNKELCHCKCCKSTDDVKNNKSNCKRMETKTKCSAYNYDDIIDVNNYLGNKHIDTVDDKHHSYKKAVAASSSNSSLPKSQSRINQHQLTTTIATQRLEKNRTQQKIFERCLKCKKLQIVRSSNSIQFCSAFLRPFALPLLIKDEMDERTKKEIETNRGQNVKIKVIIRLMYILARFLCIFHTINVPMSIANDITVSLSPQQQQRIATTTFTLNDNTTSAASIMQTSSSHHNLITQSPPELRIIATSPAPVAAPLSALMAAPSRSQDTTPQLTPVDSRIMSFVNRDNIFKHFQQKFSSSSGGGINMYRPQTTTNSTNPSSLSSFPPPYSSCSSCHLHKAKNDSLESIKLHILSKLRLKEAPKIDVPRDVPQNIIKDFNRRFDQNGRRRSFKSNSYSGEEISYYDSAASSSKSYDSREDYMQNDDPNLFNNNKEDTLLELEADGEDDIESLTKSIYIFPTPANVRHNKKGDFLNFRYENVDGTTQITRTFFHLYIRGWNWISKHEPDLGKRFKTSTNEYDTDAELSITVHRALRRRNATNYTHTFQIAELQQRIPTDLGHWIQIDLKDLGSYWTDGEDPQQVIVIKTSEPWMRRFIVTGIEKNTEKREAELTAHIEIRTQSKPGRHRRSTSLDCTESDNEVRCCRYPLKVNFTSFGWSFVVAPTDFDAYFCNGECKLGYLEQYTHTHIASLSRSASPCCSPTKMSSLTLLYFNLEQNLVLSTIPNMTVEKCSCS